MIKMKLYVHIQITRFWFTKTIVSFKKVLSCHRTFELDVFCKLTLWGIMKYSYHCTQLRRYLASSCRFIATLLITPHYKTDYLKVRLKLVKSSYLLLAAVKPNFSYNELFHEE